MYFNHGYDTAQYCNFGKYLFWFFFVRGSSENIGSLKWTYVMFARIARDPVTALVPWKHIGQCCEVFTGFPGNEHLNIGTNVFTGFPSKEKQKQTRSERDAHNDFPGSSDVYSCVELLASGTMI